MTGARQIITVIITFRKSNKHSLDIRPVLISQAGKEAPCRTDSNIGLKDLIQIFAEMEARKVEIVINGNKCQLVCGV